MSAPQFVAYSRETPITAQWLNYASNTVYTFGTADNYSSLQQAHDATDGVVNYSSKLYTLLPNTLLLTKNGAGIVGQGYGRLSADCTLLASNDASQPMITAAGIEGLTIRDVALQGFEAGPSTFNPSLLFADILGSDAAIQRVFFFRGQNLIELAECNGLLLDNCTFSAAAGEAAIKLETAFDVESGCRAITVRDCLFTPNIVFVGDTEADSFLLVGVGGALSFLSCSFDGGRRGISFEALPGQIEPVKDIIINAVEMRLQMWENVRMEGVQKVKISGGAAFQSYGDASNLWFDEGCRQIAVGDVVLQGCQRSGIYFNGQGLTVAGSTIYDVGYALDPRSIVEVLESPSPSGQVGIITSSASARQPFGEGDWILISGSTCPSVVDGRWKVIPGGLDAYTLVDSVWVDDSGTYGEARVITAGIHIGADAANVSLMPAQIGYSSSLVPGDGHDYALIIDSAENVKWALDSLYEPGHFGGLLYTPEDVPSTCAAWKERRVYYPFSFPGAVVTTSESEPLPAGLYAQVGLQMRSASGGTEVKGLAVDEAGTTYTTDSLFSTTVWSEQLFAFPRLLRVGAEMEGTMFSAGVFVIAGPPDTDLTVSVILVRLW